MLTYYRVQQREYLLEISRALTAQLNLDELLQMVLQAATDMLAGQAGLIALRGTEGTFTIRASYGLPRALVPYFAPLLTDIPDDLDEGQFRIPGLAEKLGGVASQLGLLSPPKRRPVPEPIATPPPTIKSALPPVAIVTTVPATIPPTSPTTED